MERLILNFDSDVNMKLCLQRVPILIKMYESKKGNTKSIKIKFTGKTAIVYNKNLNDSIIYVYEEV